MARIPRIPLELMARPFSLDEARAAGLTLSALRGKAWRRLGSRLYCSSRRPENPWRLLEALHQMLPAGAVFVGRTAAWMHRLGLDADGPIEVGVPVGSALRSRSGVSVRQIDARGETVVVKGLPVTTPQRTLLDLCAREPAVEALIALDAAKRMKLRWPAEIKGRPGAARLRRLTALAARAESPMETRLRWLLVTRPDLVVAQVSGSLSKPHSARFVRVELKPSA